MTQVPLKILLTDSALIDHPDIQEQIQKLNKAGHNVAVDENLKQYDFIAGPNCWLLRPEVAGLFNMAVTNARKIANADERRVNENKERLDKKRTPKGSKGAAGATRKPARRSVTVKEPLADTQHTFSAGSQLDLTTDLEADSFSAGS